MKKILSTTKSAAAILAVTMSMLGGSVLANEADHGEMDEFLAEAVSLLPTVKIVAPPATANAQVQVPADRATYGNWGPVLPWPFIPVTASNLPDGRIVSFASNQRTDFPVGPEFTYAGVYDPATGQHTEINNTNHDMFCAATAINVKGQPMFTGGRNSVRFSTYFDYENNQWVRTEDMNDGRWYASGTAMPNGTMITASGNRGTGINTVERYTEGSGWTRLYGAPWNSVNTKAFPYNFVAPDGRIFSAGPESNMHWVDVEGNGQITSTNAIFPGNRSNQSGGVAMYDEGKILFAGGGVVGGGTTNVAHVVDINSGTPVVTATAPMNFNRRFHNALMLPNGNAIMIGGNSSGLAFRDDGTIYAAEMWNPTTGVWTELADMAKPRNYHSVALMLPDGRVFSGGGGLSGNTATNHQNVQIFSPPYLFNADGSDATRPVINSAPTLSSPGQTVAVNASTGISRFTMIRMTSTTHAFSSDVRFLEVPFTTVAPGQYSLNLHPNFNVLVPGYWMLFALNAQGTPSISKAIKIAAATPPSLTDIGDQHTVQNHLVSLQVMAADGDGDSLTYSASGLPAGTQIDSTSGLITGAALTLGLHPVTVTVTDGTTPVSDSFTWEITQDSGLIAHWPFDEGTGTTAADLGGTNADGMLKNGTGWTTGVHGSAVSFDGINDSVEIPNQAPLEIGKNGNDYSLSFWMNIRQESTGAPLNIFRKTDGQRSVTLQLRPNIKRIAYWVSTTGTPSNTNISSAILPSNEWVHIAVVKNGNVFSLHVDGIPDSFINLGSPTVSNNGTIYLGRDQWINSAKSYFDELAIYDRALSSSEISFMADPSNRVLGANSAPQVTNPGSMSDPLTPINLTIIASDANGDNLTYTASNLPTGLSIHTSNGTITGTPTVPGIFNCQVTVSDGIELTPISFQWEIRDQITASPVVPGPKQVGTSAQFTVNSTGQNLSYLWNFGDGTSPVTTSSSTRSHTFSQAGRYTVIVTVTDDLGQSVQVSFYQSIYAAATANRPTVSQSVIYETRQTANDRVWNVNPDNNTVSVFDAVAESKLAEIPVGQEPRALAIAPNGQIWVTNRDSATISRISASTLSVSSTITLPHASRPHGIAFAPSGSKAFVALEASGKLIALNPVSGSITDTLDVGANPRHVSVNHSSTKVYVSRFITPPVSGEATAAPAPLPNEGVEVVVVNATAMQVSNTIVLHNSTVPDTTDSARGIPNYLGPAAISPDGTTAWVASKQDNIQRGIGRDGNPLTHDNTVRSITSRIDLATEIEDPTQRIDHDNAGIGSTSIFGRNGNLVFSALEGSRHVAITDVFNGIELKRFRVQRAPQGLAISPDGRTLYVHNFMSRTVSSHDVSQFVDGIGEDVIDLNTFNAVANETLTSTVLLGKQHFYDAQDTRLSLQEYISCASCHNDGAQDGRVWDLTGFGEGLRNTIDLRGRAGLAHGPLHWSANFDEVQDFEGQIRNLSGGGGLISNGNPHPSLGAPNSGRSADLDALADYVASLSTFPASPLRDVDSTLSSAAEAGKLVFASANCASCHSGDTFTDSAPGNLHDIGTLKPTSGDRLGGALAGIDTPTLRGVATGAPYLHDGSAASIEDAIAAHNTSSTLTQAEIAQIATYLREIDGSEPAPPTGGGSDEITPDADSIALYHFNTDYKDATTNNLDLTAAGGVVLTGSNLGWMQNPAGKVARFSAIGDTLSVIIPDSLLLPSSGTPLMIETRIYPRQYLGYGIDNLPLIALHQEWDTHLQLEDSKWGSNPTGPRYYASGGELANGQQWANSVTINTWHKVQISFDGQQTVDLWVDGVLINSLAVSPNIDRSNNWTLTLGNFDGDLDELLISRSEVNPQVDVTPPTVALTTPSNSVNAPFAVTAAFSENVTGMAQSDLVISNGSISNFAGSGATYSFTITPTAQGTVGISIPASRAQDLSGNPNTASNTLAVNYTPPTGGNGDEAAPTAQTIALYHFNTNFEDESGNAFHLSPTGNVALTSSNLGWMQNPTGKVARFDSISDSLSVNIPDNYLLPNSNSPITIDARIYPRNYLGYGEDNLPIIALHQDWDAHFQLEDSKWGSNPKGPELFAAGAVLANAQQWSDVATLNQWHHLQISYDGIDTVSAWIDGNPLGAISISPNADRSNDWTLTLGNFDGDIDEVHIHAVSEPAGSSPITSQSPTQVALDTYNYLYGTNILFPLDSDTDSDGWVDLLELAHGSHAEGSDTPDHHLALVDIGGGEIAAAYSIPVQTTGEPIANGFRSVAFTYTVQASTNMEQWTEPITLIDNPVTLPDPPAGYRFITFRADANGMRTFFRTTVNEN